MLKLRQILLRSRGTRLLLAVVFCALFLNGVEYLVHNHAAEQQGSAAGQLTQAAGQHSTGQQANSAPHAEQCGYCAAFSGLSLLSDSPVIPRFAVTLTLLVFIGVLAAPVFRRPFTVAQPRGPPRY